MAQFFNRMYATSQLSNKIDKLTKLEVDATDPHAGFQEKTL